MDAEINGVWSTDLKQFDFDTDMSSMAISRAMSREPWSREYFETLKEYIYIIIELSLFFLCVEIIR